MLCGKSAADNQLLTVRGNILTCPCLSLQFVQTSVTHWRLNNVPLWIYSALVFDSVSAKLKSELYVC